MLPAAPVVDRAGGAVGTGHRTGAVATDHAAAIGETVSAPSAAPAGRRRVLIIEDEPDLVRGLRDALDFEGFEVLSAGLGREGSIWRGSRSRFDPARPDVARHERLRGLRGDRASNMVIPIIMLTARSQENDKIGAWSVAPTTT